MVRNGSDLTQFPGIGKGIAAALREIVFSGKLGQLELLLASVPPEVAALNEYPKLDPERVTRVFKKLKISTVSELKSKLESGVIGTTFGPRMEAHFRGAFRESHQMLLYDADELAAKVRRYLVAHCGVRRAEIAGEVRRRVEVIGELSFVIDAPDFGATVDQLQQFGGGIDLIDRSARDATFQLPGTVLLTLHAANSRRWGVSLLAATGSSGHLEKLESRGLDRVLRSREAHLDEPSAYQAMGLTWIPPELREGHDEVALAADDALPDLVELTDIRGELHAHTTTSDGAQSIEDMAAAAKARGFSYLGITDHSQSLKIARGVAIADLWAQIRRIDKLNGKLRDFRILKSAEVDILADGSLDYPDDLLAELDYTICSIHSRFRLGKVEQTERVLRAMDHPAFTILGHATGRLLLKRAGYDLEMDRIIAHAKQTGCFFEINASPDRLDLSAENVRLVTGAGIRIAINTDAHHVRELDYLACGVDVARRGGVGKGMVLNALSWPKLERLFRR